MLGVGLESEVVLTLSGLVLEVLHHPAYSSAQGYGRWAQMENIVLWCGPPHTYVDRNPKPNTPTSTKRKLKPKVAKWYHPSSCSHSLDL